MSDSDEITFSRNSFPTTLWGLVAMVGDSAPAQARNALAELCRDYWYPLYAFVRRKGYGPEDAQDLVQGFFASLLERESLRDLDPERGRFRSFLMACCSNYLADCRDHVQAQKRAGGRVPIPIDSREAEARYATEPWHGETAERIFERRWALDLLGRVLARLDSESDRRRRRRRPDFYFRLRSLLAGDVHETSIGQIAAEMGLTEGAVRAACHRLRARYRALLREEVARTTLNGDDVSDELTALMAALAN